MATLVKCKCQHCNQNIEFDSDGEGQTIVCPNCGMETKLFMPIKVERKDRTPPKDTGQSVILLSVLNAIVCIVSFGLIFVGCSRELAEITSPDGSAIRSAGNAVQYCSGFMLFGICLAVSGLIRLIRK